jgi:hypothetical protein
MLNPGEPRNRMLQGTAGRKPARDILRPLERTQGGTMNATPWMEWFPGCLSRANDSS